MPLSPACVPFPSARSVEDTDERNRHNCNRFILQLARGRKVSTRRCWSVGTLSAEMSGLDYMVLSDSTQLSGESARWDDYIRWPFRVVAGVGLCCTLLWAGLSQLQSFHHGLTSSALALQFGKRVVRPKDDDQAKGFHSQQGREEVMVRPGMVPSAAQLLHPARSPPHCLFSYGLLLVHDEGDKLFAAGSSRRDGWVYGARLSPNAPLAFPTGQPGDVLQGRLLCWPAPSFPKKLSLLCQFRGYKPSQPFAGKVRSGVLSVVLEDGNAVPAHWFFQDPPRSDKDAPVTHPPVPAVPPLPPTALLSASSSSSGALPPHTALSPFWTPPPLPTLPKQPLPGQSLLEGVVERVTYSNAENGYSVIRLRPNEREFRGANRDGLVTVVGHMPDLCAGESVRLHGVWKQHKQHGQQLEVTQVEQLAPSTMDGLRRYLGSGLIKGVGPGIAKKIVGHFGMDTLHVLDERPESLVEVYGIGNATATLIAHGWVEQREIKEVMLFLQSHRVETAWAVKIFKRYGNKSIEQVMEDPYQLARDKSGIGFKTADRIARNLGMGSESPQRMEAGLVYALQTLQDRGHVFAKREELLEQAALLLGVPVAMCKACLPSLISRGLVVATPLPVEPYQENGDPEAAIYSPAMFTYESGLATRIQLMLSDDDSLSRIDKARAKAFLQTLPGNANYAHLTPQQQAAVVQALTVKLSVLTGGPGTGKTTTLRTVIEGLKAIGATFHLASPTGRAAKRLREATGCEAATIHRLLGLQPLGAQRTRDSEQGPFETDMLIIDEASMLDLPLCYKVFKELPPGAHLLLVGDVDQLPSVGAGSVLRDVIDSRAAAVTQLDVIFRQAETSLIVTNANAINKGHMPDLSNKGKDFFLFTVEDPEKAADMVVDLASERITKKFGFDPKQIQVLVPMYRGSAGAETLNKLLQDRLTPSRPSRPERIASGRTLRVGDKVMQTKNNYDLGVFNGDAGIITDIDEVEQQIAVEMDDHTVLYDFGDVNELVLAYAISVHRSQGSEYPVVVLPVLTQHFQLLQRNLLYTAITRARELVVLVGTKRAISIAVNNDKVMQRNSGLVWRIQHSPLLDPSENSKTDQSSFQVATAPSGMDFPFVRHRVVSAPNPKMLWYSELLDPRLCYFKLHDMSLARGSSQKQWVVLPRHSSSFKSLPGLVNLATQRLLARQMIWDLLLQAGLAALAT
eukprot:g49770.t1